LTSENIFEVIAETVIPLTAGQSEKLQTVLFNKINKKVVIKNLINETLIGGMRIRINDQVIDSTISGKIIRLREKINKL
jgi:F-type H+-transporting ATPase subunit delta